MPSLLKPFVGEHSWRFTVGLCCIGTGDAFLWNPLHLLPWETPFPPQSSDMFLCVLPLHLTDPLDSDADSS